LTQLRRRGGVRHFSPFCGRGGIGIPREVSFARVFALCIEEIIFISDRSFQRLLRQHVTIGGAGLRGWQPA
jgi:hypothetical protein